MAPVFDCQMSHSRLNICSVVQCIWNRKPFGVLLDYDDDIIPRFHVNCFCNINFYDIIHCWLKFESDIIPLFLRHIWDTSSYYSISKLCHKRLTNENNQNNKIINDLSTKPDHCQPILLVREDREIPSLLEEIMTSVLLTLCCNIFMVVDAAIGLQPTL